MAEQFLTGSLVSWFISCLEDPNSLTTYDDLVDGVLLHRVFLQIHPEPFHSDVTPSNEDLILRIRNLEFILENVKQFYEENLGSLLVKLPDVTSLAKEPESHIEDMKLLLLLILGCAVQCKRKEEFIMNITSLPETTQLEIVECIKMITDYQDIVVTPDSCENACKDSLFNQMKKLIEERNFYYEKWKNLELKEIELQNNSIIIPKSEYLNKPKLNSTMKENEENHHCIEVADLKSKVRKLLQELEEKSESLIESKGEIEHNIKLIAKLNKENQKLALKARNAESYRDELDATIEKAEKADRLEKEVSRYRKKLNVIEDYKNRIEVLQEDNKVLLETKEALEEELRSQRKRADKVSELEAKTVECNRLLSNMTLEHITDREKYHQLQEENVHLQCVIKSMNKASIVEPVSDFEEPEIMNKSLSDQLSSSAQTRALKLELENRRLSTMVESLKENSSQGNSSRILELEKKKKNLSLKFDSLTKKYERLVERNSSLEFTYNLAKQENKQLQASLAKQKEEIQDQINLESQHDQLSKDYMNRLQEREILKTNLKDLKNELKVLRDSYEELEMKNNTVQNEREALEKEVKILKVLKKEHSKLKEDFRNLYTKSKILSVQNKNLEGKNNGDINKLKLKLTEMQGELCAKEERCSNLESTISNLNRRCEELLQVNADLKNDRRKLMEYSQSLSLQNQDFFMQTLEDKDNFYTEKKNLSDTINQMNCQKMKLEEKIMDFYKNAPTPTSINNKEKSLRTNFVKKVKKVGSDLFRKNRRSSDSWEVDLKRSEDKRCEFEFGNSTFDSSKTMTLGRRSVDGKRGPRDRFSLDNLSRGKMTYFSEECISTLPSTPDKSFREILNSYRDETQHEPESKSKNGTLNRSVFEVINETEDTNSIQGENQEGKKLESNLKKSPSRSGSKNSLWLEYGCA